MFANPTENTTGSRLVLHKQPAIAFDINVGALDGGHGAKGRSRVSLFGNRGRVRVSRSPYSDTAGDEDAYHLLDEFPADLALEPNILEHRVTRQDCQSYFDIRPVDSVSEPASLGRLPTSSHMPPTPMRLAALH